MMTLRTCVAPCTPMENTPSEIATPSTKDTLEKIAKETIKKTIRKKETTMKTRDSKNPEGQWQIIFAGVPDSRSKHQENLALRTIMAAEPATPRYLNWSQYPI